MNTEKYPLIEKFQGNEFSIITLENEPEKTRHWFRATQVMKTLDFKNTKEMLETHCKEWQYREFKHGNGRPALYVCLSGLFRLIMRSKSPMAVDFQDWVTDDVLPKLFASGGYIMPTATSEQLEALQQEIALLQDKQAKALEMLKTRRVNYFAYQMTLKETLALAKNTLMGVTWGPDDLALFQIHEKQEREMRRSERLNNAAKSCQRYF